MLLNQSQSQRPCRRFFFSFKFALNGQLLTASKEFSLHGLKFSNLQHPWQISNWSYNSTYVELSQPTLLRD